MSRSSTDAVQHSRLATDDSEMNPMSHAHVDSFDNEPLGDDLLDELESELGIARPADTTNRTPVRAQPPLSASKAIEPKAEQLRAAASQALGDQALVPMNVVSDQSPAPTSALHSRVLCFFAGVFFVVVAVFIGVYYLTNGEGITVVWPGQSPEKDLLNGPKYNVQINLLAGERYFFDVKESGDTIRTRSITTVFPVWKERKQVGTKSHSWNESSTTIHSSDHQYEVVKMCGNSRWSYMRFLLSGFNLTLQESGQLDSRIRSTAGLLVKSPAHLSVRHALRATALATASNATDNTTATPIPTPAPSTPSASPSATPTPTTTPSAPTTPVPTSAAAPTNPPATRAPTPEPGPPPYSAAEIKAEFSRMLSHVLSGHTFTAKLAHEGTVLKRDATNLKSSLNFAFESFAEQIVQRIFRGVKSKFVSRFRENVKSEVRKNLVSAGTSISTQLQEDVFQYMQSHNRKIVVGQSWVRVMRSGYALLNATFTLLGRFTDGRPRVLNEHLIESRNGTVRLSLEQARPTLPPRARSPWRRPRWGRGINAGLADLFPPASADAATTAPPSDSNTPSDIVEVAPSDTPAPSDHSDEFEPHQSRTLLSTPRLQQEDGELFFPYEQTTPSPTRDPEDVADEAVLLDPSYGDPLPDEAPAILCTKDERFKPSSRDKGFLAIRMKALVTIVDPAVLMENFDLEQLIPAYASMVASKRMEIVKTLTVMNYVGMLTVGETTGVVMDGASSMTSNVTLALRVVPVGPRQNRNGMKLESVEQQINDEQDAADQQLILDRLQLLSEASISHTKFANGIRSLQHQLRSAFGQTDTESSSHPELAGFGLAGFAPTHTTIDIGVHASSRERVKGRVMIECPSERF